MRTSIVSHVVSKPAAVLTAILIAILSSGALTASAQGPGMDSGMGPGFAHRPPMERTMGDHGRWWNRPRMIERLKLTQDQRAAMDRIFYQHRDKLIDLQAALEHAELAMHPLMSADQPDRAALESQIDKIVTARGDLERANALFLLDIRMQLTADQWNQLRTMHWNRMDHRPGMMGHNGGPGHWNSGHWSPGHWNSGQPNAWHRNPAAPGGQPAPPPPAGEPVPPPATNPPAAQAPASGSGQQQ